MILERLNFADLLSVAEINQKMSQIAPSVFRQKYSKYEFKMTNLFKLPTKEPTKEPPTSIINVAGIKVTTETISSALEWLGLKTKDQVNRAAVQSHIEGHLTIELKSYETILKTFTHFGHVISRLKMDYYTHGQPQAIFLGELISNYSSKTVSELVLYSRVEEHNFKPFESVRIVALGLDLFAFSKHNLAINDLFPAVEQLHINGYSTSLDYIDCHMPHLNHLYVKMPDEFWWNHLFNGFKVVLAKNQQLQSIELNAFPNIPLKYLPSISRLPNLQTLALFGSLSVEHEIRFENVTQFWTKPWSSSPNNLRFPKLQSLNIKNKANGAAVWLDFLKKHNHLTRLHLDHSDFSNEDQSFDYIDDDLMQFVAELTNLTELSLVLYCRRISKMCIRQLLENHKNLMQLDLEFYTMLYRNTVREYLRQVATVDDEWNVSDFLNHGLSCHRKDK